MMASFAVSVVKTLTRHKAVFCYVIILWGIGTLISTALMGSWNWSRDYVQQFPPGSDHRHQTGPLKQQQLVLSSSHPKLSRPIKYCHLPSTLALGQEGQPSSANDRLEAVVVITRHGDRGPLHEFRNQSQVRCGFNVSLHPDLQAFVQHMQAKRRRSGRDPFAQFPLLPQLGNTCVPGQLSTRGLYQMVRTGALLQEVYLKKWNLLGGGDAWLPDQVVAYSTTVLRTYQSALALLYGLLPGFDLSRVAVRPGLGLAFCYTRELCECTAVDKLEQQIQKERWNHVTSHPAVQGLVKHLNPFVKARPTEKDVGWPDEIFDTLMVYLCHGAALPCLAEGNCATIDHLNNVLAFLDWSGKQIANLGAFKRSSRLRVHGFLVDLSRKLRDVRDGKRKHKFVLYSAHDVTLIPVMSALGLFDGVKVPFASRLVIELYSNAGGENSDGEGNDGEGNGGDDGETAPAANVVVQQQQQQRREKKDEDRNKVVQQQHHIRVLYNGRDMTRRVIFCRQNKTATASGGGGKQKQNRHQEGSAPFVCPLDKFVDFVEKDLFQDLRVANYKQACTIQPTPIPEDDPWA